MKKNLIMAYSAVNLGDDLFIKILCDYYPTHKFYIYTDKELSSPYKNIPNLTVISRPYYVSFIDKLLTKLKINKRMSYIKNKSLAKKFDSIIHIGGSLFIEDKAWPYHTKEYKSLIENSKNFFVLGSNFGPYSEQGFVNSFREIFQKMNGATFRDQFSYNLFSDLSNTHLAPDIVFSLNKKNVQGIKKDRYIVMSILDLSWREELKEYQDDYEEAILNLSKQLIDQGISVVLMSFCEAQGDEKAINRIIEKYSHEKLSSYFYRGDMDESLTVIKSSSGVIATRFHSLILGWVFEKPVFPFIYSDKTENLLNDANYKEYSLPVSESKNINLDKVIKQLLHSGIQDVSREKTQAVNHFTYIDDFLKS